MAGLPADQAIKGCVFLCIILHTGIDHPGRAVDIPDDLRKVGSRYHRCAFFEKIMQHTAGNCRPLLRLGPGPQFIQQHQGPGAGLIKNGRDTCHMSGKSGKTLLNGLFVSDIDKQCIQERK